MFAPFLIGKLLWGIRKHKRDCDQRAHTHSSSAEVKGKRKREGMLQYWVANHLPNIPTIRHTYINYEIYRLLNVWLLKTGMSVGTTHTTLLLWFGEEEK